MVPRDIWHVTSQKNGTSALGLQRVLGLGSYQTAWTWLHKLRRAMVRPGRDASAASLVPFVVESVEPGSTVHTDGWLGYEPLTKKGYQQGGEGRRLLFRRFGLASGRRCVDTQWLPGVNKFSRTRLRSKANRSGFAAPSPDHLAINLRWLLVAARVLIPPRTPLFRFSCEEKNRPLTK